MDYKVAYLMESADFDDKEQFIAELPLMFADHELTDEEYAREVAIAREICENPVHYEQDEVDDEPLPFIF